MKIEFLRTDKTYLFGFGMHLISQLVSPRDVDVGNMVVLLVLGLFSGLGFIFMLIGFVFRIVKTIKDHEFRKKREQTAITVLESLVPLYTILFPIGIMIYVVVTA